MSSGLSWIWTLWDHSIIHLTESSYYQNVPAVAGPCPSGTLRRFFTGNRYFSQDSNKRVTLEGKFQTQSSWINHRGRSRSHLLNQWDYFLCGNYNYYSSLVSWTFSQPFGSLGHTLPLPYVTFPSVFLVPELQATFTLLFMRTGVDGWPISYLTIQSRGKIVIICTLVFSLSQIHVPSPIWVPLSAWFDGSCQEDVHLLGSCLAFGNDQCIMFRKRD